MTTDTKRIHGNQTLREQAKRWLALQQSVPQGQWSINNDQSGNGPVLYFDCNSMSGPQKMAAFDLMLFARNSELAQDILDCITEDEDRRSRVITMNMDKARIAQDKAAAVRSELAGAHDDLMKERRKASRLKKDRDELKRMVKKMHDTMVVLEDELDRLQLAERNRQLRQVFNVKEPG